MDKTVQSLQKQGIKAAGRPCHVGDKQQILDLVQFALDTFGKLDICISNAAVNPAAGDILDMPDGAIDKVLNINIKSAIQLAQAARPHLPKVSRLLLPRLAVQHALCMHGKAAQGTW